MNNPNNQHQQVLWYLYMWDNFSLVDVIEDSLFIKFQSRLSDLEIKHGEFTIKTRKSFINRFGRKSSYYIYSCENKKLLLDLYEKV